ncbi:hypothetical protein ACFFRL_12005 [Agromyces hippuratus]|uniref:hypothetical protein n=1 Tax=Agromyces hippuratus TaxID=286438 RepID=UPI0035ED40A6
MTGVVGEIPQGDIRERLTDGFDVRGVDDDDIGHMIPSLGALVWTRRGHIGFDHLDSMVGDTSNGESLVRPGRVISFGVGRLNLTLEVVSSLGFSEFG